MSIILNVRGKDDLYEDDGDFQSLGEFLLSVPTASRNMKLPSGKIFSVIE